MSHSYVKELEGFLPPTVRCGGANPWPSGASAQAGRQAAHVLHLQTWQVPQGPHLSMSGPLGDCLLLVIVGHCWSLLAIHVISG